VIGKVGFYDASKGYYLFFGWFYLYFDMSRALLY
jgi:hypothetical protein